MSDVPISFPGLNLSFNVSNIAFSVGPFEIHWYGILIALGLLLALFYAVKRTKEFKITFDDLTDIVLFSTIFAVIGARLYYCIFYVDSTGARPYFTSLKNLITILYIWDGGLAFYGAIIGAFVTVLITCKIKKINPLPFLDIGGLGFLIGQAIGRWGNFFNREAFGAATNLPWRMVIDSSGTGYHPCFLYESLWCVLGFVILHFYSKHRKFDGELFLMYLGWNGLGRFFIEGLRTDSLILFGSIRVSQLLAAILFIVSTGLIIYFRIKFEKRTAFEGYESVYGDLISEDENKQQEESTDEDENKNSEDISESTNKVAAESTDKNIAESAKEDTNKDENK